MCLLSLDIARSWCVFATRKSEHSDRVAVSARWELRQHIAPRMAELFYQNHCLAGQTTNVTSESRVPEIQIRRFSICSQAPAYNAYQRAQAANVNLNGPVQEFCQRVRDWPQRRAGMAIAVRHIKQRDLPPSCFAGGAFRHKVLV